MHAHTTDSLCSSVETQRCKATRYQQELNENNYIKLVSEKKLFRAMTEESITKTVVCESPLLPLD